MARASFVVGAVFLVSAAAQVAACENSAAWGSPALREGEGIRRGDGGIWVTGDSGTWFLPSNPFIRPLRATPALRMLCMLRGGNLTGSSEYDENSQGTWIGDIPMILGEPETRVLEPQGAQTSYIYALPREDADVSRENAGRDGGLTPKQVTISLGFERVDAVWPPAEAGVPMDEPYFLTRIDAVGIQQPTCWSPNAENSPAAAPSGCDECKRNGRDFFLCKEIVEHVEDCYARQ